MARARVQNVGGDANNPIGMENIINQFYFVDSSSTTVVDWRGGCDIFPNDIKERYAALFPGGTAEVSVCFEIPKSETDLALMYRPGHFYDKPVFLALANPDSVEPVRVVDASAEPPPGQAAGRSRFNPAPPGRQVESADGLMALTLVSVNPDADFSEFFYSYYEPSDRTAEGNRLVSARVRVQNVGGSVNSALIIKGGFALVGSSAVQFRDRGCRATRQDPAIFLGGIAEIDVCFETPESETDLVLIHTSPNPPRQPGRLRAPQLEKPRRYLAFANPDVVEAARVVDAPLEPSPGQTAGHFRSSPAPLGASAYNPWGMAISIVSANSGRRRRNPKRKPVHRPARRRQPIRRGAGANRMGRRERLKHNARRHLPVQPRWLFIGRILSVLQPMRRAPGRAAIRSTVRRRSGGTRRLLRDTGIGDWLNPVLRTPE